MWQASQIFATQVNKIALFLLSLRFICGDSDLIRVVHAMLCFNFCAGVWFSLCFLSGFYATCRPAGFREGEISKIVDNEFVPRILELKRDCSQSTKTRLCSLSLRGSSNLHSLLDLARFVMTFITSHALEEQGTGYEHIFSPIQTFNID